MVHEMFWPQGSGKSTAANALFNGLVKGEGKDNSVFLFNRNTSINKLMDKTPVQWAQQLSREIKYVVVDLDGMTETSEKIVSTFKSEFKNDPQRILFIFKTPERQDYELIKLRAEVELNKLDIRRLTRERL